MALSNYARGRRPISSARFFDNPENAASILGSDGQFGSRNYGSSGPFNSGGRFHSAGRFGGMLGKLGGLANVVGGAIGQEELGQTVEALAPIIGSVIDSILPVILGSDAQFGSGRGPYASDAQFGSGRGPYASDAQFGSGRGAYQSGGFFDQLSMKDMIHQGVASAIPIVTAAVEANLKSAGKFRMKASGQFGKRGTPAKMAAAAKFRANAKFKAAQKVVRAHGKFKSGGKFKSAGKFRSDGSMGGGAAPMRKLKWN